MRLLPSLLLAAGVVACQTDPAPPTQAATAPASAPVVSVSVPPVGPVDLDTPYASRRDAARHWLQTMLANLRQQRDLAGGIRGAAQALAVDRSYALAAFDLGILAAIGEKWDDAAAAFDEAARLDGAAFAAAAKPQAERARMLATLEKTPEGRRKRRYDEAMSDLLPLVPKMSSDDALTALAELGRIDPRRWEAPALLAGLVGDGSGYQAAAKFLDIAIRNAARSPAIPKLGQAKHAAELEVRYESARLNAADAAENGKYADSARYYETAWKAVPARLVSGMDAVSADLLADDTAHAAVLLVRLRGSGDTEFSALSAAMLKELEAVEPATKSTASDAVEFFRDAGPGQAPRIADLLPPIDRTSLDLYSTPLPKLIDDPAPVVLLASLSADAATAAAVPVLPPPTIPGEHPWAEIAARAPATSDPAAAPPRSLQTADLASGVAAHHTLNVVSSPAGARVLVGESTNPACETPCNLLVADGTYNLRLALAGYQEENQTVKVHGSEQELMLILNPIRGSVMVVTSAPAPLTVNGTTIDAQAPAELSLAPGAYRIGARIGADLRERDIMVKPGARLRLEIQP